ncbi:aldolase/citrate lyase family protein [Intestinimonas massiliensis]|uniref:Aldolase/citrate lyase family protein n=1 Tax=Intestinimonas massiliensis (ex Afouda et al. 2020) TaxID=1673721 RepID=A0ABS9MA23_9FIRM|nr:aldolase/citrate lyase family protein [Intestinimonas massiliensis (ex Afouda et al. 2020)]MCG4527645.1 aldolase/citrate lyase family protein [Intestinimonas massiliensis (ex Afouda et al. 2020)]MCQ4807485.1 aldolase/citrate lyase family protein [Intestinimonas massiliensis (ex Afouda et al. 2020)]BDE86369.1 siderophore biosynthesis protein SbnG [Oscillospiraceae bacterium]
MNTNKLKEQLKQKKPAIGSFVRMNSISVEILGLTGWDFVIIDAEHGVHTMEDVSNMIRAAKAVGITSIVRVPGTEPNLIQRSLDGGAEGVQIPQITNLKQLKDAVSAARYYPKGNRGACAYSAATGYSTTPFQDHINTSNDEVLVVVHVENAWSADHIEEILDVGGIDVIFCGPWDMSQSLGIPGQVTAPEVVNRIDKVISTCRDRGISTGIFVQQPEQAEIWIKRGVSYLAGSVDVGIYAEASKKFAADMKAYI